MAVTCFVVSFLLTLFVWATVRIQEREQICGSVHDPDVFQKIARIQQIDGAVVPNRYPYAAVLQHRQSKSRFCQGVLIEGDLVLTAAHCVDEFAKYSEKFPLIAIGATHSENDGDAENRRVCRTIIHEDWETLPQNGYDIALLELDRPSSKHTVKIDVEALDHHNKWRGETLIFLGWEIDKHGNNPVVMNQIQLEVWSEDRCQRNLGFVEFMDSMICAKVTGVNLGVCNGDSGGPLVQANEGCGENDLLTGALSFGPPCYNRTSRARYADVFTKVSSFRDWIRKRGEGASIQSKNVNCRKPLGQTIKSEGCLIVEGVDMNFGIGTMNCGRRQPRDTPEECCQLCRDTKGCRVWTWLRVTDKYNKAGSCWLRSVIGPASRCSICVSGLVKKDFLDQTEGQYLLGMNFTGSVIAEHKIAHEEECLTKCKKNKKCKAYTVLGKPCYDCPETWSKDASKCRTCILRDSIPEPEICDSSEMDCNSAVLMTRVDETDNIHLLRELLPGLERKYHIIKQITIPGPCRMLVGVDYRDPDESLRLNVGEEDIVNSPEDCCHLCKTYEECRAWTMITVKTKNQPRGACYLSSEVPPEIPCSACTSGIIEDRYRECTYKRASTTAPFSKIISLDVNSEKEEPTVFQALDCCQECRLREGCKMWSFCSKGRGGCSSETMKCDSGDDRWGPYGERCAGDMFPEHACILGAAQDDESGLDSTYDEKGMWASGALASAEAVSLEPPCALLEGVTFEDPWVARPVLTEGPAECCQKCLETEGCKTWTRSRVDRTCIMRGAPGRPWVNQNTDSGVVLDRVTQKEIEHLSPVVRKPNATVPIT